MYAVIDIETTGLDVRHDRIIEVAIVDLNEDLVVVNEWCRLVNPLVPVGPSWIHGLHDADVALAMPFERYADEIRYRLQDHLVVGHNLEFDLAILRSEWRRIGYSLPTGLRKICTAELAYAAGFRPFTLEACCLRLKIHHEHAHTALGDARATAALLSRLLALRRG